MLSPKCRINFRGFVRRDQYNYYPSDNPFADLSPIQQETVSQNRTLTNAGLRSDISYVKGIHNIKAGVTYQQTLLDENTRFGIVDPTLNAPALMRMEHRLPDSRSCELCRSNHPNVASNPNATPVPANPGMLRTDSSTPAPTLTRGGTSFFPFRGHTDVKLALAVRSGHDHQGSLVFQSRPAWRLL